LTLQQQQQQQQQKKHSHVSKQSSQGTLCLQVNAVLDSVSKAQQQSTSKRQNALDHGHHNRAFMAAVTLRCAKGLKQAYHRGSPE
jgi:hypothetical protein